VSGHNELSLVAPCRLRDFIDTTANFLTRDEVKLKLQDLSLSPNEASRTRHIVTTSGAPISKAPTSKAPTSEAPTPEELKVTPIWMPGSMGSEAQVAPVSEGSSDERILCDEEVV